jgi:predicted MPP superfamily phosphohydrolase
MRCRFLLGFLGGAAAGAAAALTYRLLTERWEVTVTRATFGVRNLPTDLEGLTLAHLTDFHCGPLVPKEFVEDVVRRTNLLKPDLVVLTGDYVDEDMTNLTECAAALGKLAAPLGVYAVLGNHDYEVGAEEVAQALAAQGMNLLRNARTALGRGERKLWLVGLDDTAGHREEFRETLAGIPADEPIVMLSHSPDLLNRSADVGVELILSGHTHGGQVRLPGIGAPHAPSMVTTRFAVSHVRRRHTRLYVGRGVGMTVLPVRLNCPPEIGLFTLQGVLR